MKMKKLGCILTAIILGIQTLFTPCLAEQTESADIAAAEAQVVPEDKITTNEIPGWPQGPMITPTAGVLLETSTNNLLYAKNADEVLYPGSSVKIMTLLLALENSDLSDEVTMTSTGVSGVTDGGVNISAQLDEVFTMEQCLYAIMLASANDIALQVAEHIGGSVENFVDMMNERAGELGCTNTVFVNPTGLPNTEQHTTAHDMALIMKAAIENDTFVKIATTESYSIPATNMSGGGRSLTNSFAMIDNLSPLYYKGCLGGKLGFTDASGETLVSAATRGGLTLVCVILQGAVDSTSLEAARLFDYGFDHFELKNFGRSDFDVLSGGIVLSPKDADESAFEKEEVETEEGVIQRTYLFSGLTMGSAICQKTEVEIDHRLEESEEHLKEAQAFSDNKSPIPYAVIGGIGFLVVLVIIIAIVKVIKS